MCFQNLDFQIPIMFKFLGLLLLFAVFGFLVIGVLLGRVIRFFGPTNRSKASSRQTNNKTNNTPDPSLKKFSKSEGEYIDYEEIKDE